ncbi:MAG TPA: hypothetical protein VFV98_13490 [Vicinamibacterales bacterium]|nr:hypothetical protein [Vicinamibacterales bacterium]
MLRATCFVLGAILCAESAAQTPTPQSVASELLAADRAFSTAAAKLNVVEGLSAMFADDVIMPAPPGVFIEGKAKAIEALTANPDNVALRAPAWQPLGGGVSADGLHGYTYGLMQIAKPPATLHVKYMAYWVKGLQGWRAVAYKRRGAAMPTEPPTTTPKMLLPERLTAPMTDAAALAKQRDSLAATEKSFSDDAQKIGLGAAFEKYGSPDAVNMGGPSSGQFTQGNVAISREVGAGGLPNSSPVSWGADFRTIVASSGDLGITFGYIRVNGPGPDGKTPPATPFFTIWRRANASAPWKYVAE